MKFLGFLSILTLIGGIAQAECPQINPKVLEPFKVDKNASIEIDSKLYELVNPEEDVKNLPVVRGVLTGNSGFSATEDGLGRCTYTYRGVGSFKKYSFGLRERFVLE